MVRTELHVCQVCFTPKPPAPTVNSPHKTTNLLWNEAVSKGGVNLMGQAQWGHQLPTALTEGAFHKGFTFIATRKLFPLIIRGIWGEGRPGVTGVSKQLPWRLLLVWAGLGQGTVQCKTGADLHCSTCWQWLPERSAELPATPRSLSAPCQSAINT